jgi:ribosomal protein S3AE
MSTKINNLLKGKTTQLKHDDINEILHSIPNLGNANRKKLEKALRSGKGCRIQLDGYEMEGSGFNIGKMAKKSAKFVKNNKQLNNLKDQAINKGLNYAIDQVGLDENTGALVKGLSKQVINKQFDQLAGEGFNVGKYARKGAKFVKNNKQLNNLKDQAINKGLNYAIDQVGLDENTGALVKGLSKQVINKQFDQLAGEGFGLKKVLKYGSKALKVGNKISNALGYDDLDNMAIDLVTNQTLGRIDPSLGRIASNALQKVADKQLDKYSGGAINPYLPDHLRGGGIDGYVEKRVQITPEMRSQMPFYRGGSMVYNDNSNIVHQGHDAFSPETMNLPMFDRLKQQQEFMRGSGFVVR